MFSSGVRAKRGQMAIDHKDIKTTMIYVSLGNSHSGASRETNNDTITPADSERMTGDQSLQRIFGEGTEPALHERFHRRVFVRHGEILCKIFRLAARSLAKQPCEPEISQSGRFYEKRDFGVKPKSL
jgi:hypothetical protein